MYTVKHCYTILKYVFYVCVILPSVIHLCLSGRGAILPKSGASIWDVLTTTHEAMSANLQRHTVVIPIPVEVCKNT